MLTREADRVVLLPQMDLVAVNLRDLREAMRGALANGARELVLDLAKVQMVDSSGIGLLISAHNSLQKAGGQLAVVHASRDLLDLFRMMRIHQHFSVSGD
jgi:anti-anti-sigma factor